MSDAADSLPAEGLLFPAFMYGDKSTCRRKMKAEAKKWAKCYREGREFPVPKLAPIAPGARVFTHESTADLVGSGYSFSTDAKIVTISHTAKQEGLHIQWRAYLLDDLKFEAESAAKRNYAEGFTFRRAFVPFVCKYPWGAISAAVIDCLLNSIELTVPRIDGVLRFWDALDTLKYVDLHERPISLAQLIIKYFDGNIAMWVDQPTGNIRTDLQAAVEHMRNAPEEEIRSRLIKRLRKQVDIKKELQHREWLKSPGVIEAGLEALRNRNCQWYDDLTGGQTSELGTFLRDLDSDHSNPEP